MKYFTLDEMTRSVAAFLHKIDNTPTDEAKAALIALIDNVLDPAREEWGLPIYVNSGYRSSLLNTIVGGAADSQHIKGEAADITVGTPYNNMLLARIIAKQGHFDQLILENAVDDRGCCQWLHVSYTTHRDQRRQVLIKYKGRRGYQCFDVKCQ